MDDNRQYFIYKYTFPNGKVYIGQTYRGSGRYGTTWGYKTQLVYRAMLKYKDFKKEVLEYCDVEIVDEREKYYIDKYDSMNFDKGYNRDSGGNLRKAFSPETRKLISQAHNGRSILQFDLEGNFIAEWEYIELAADILNINSKNISACLHGKANQSGGFQWKFKDDEKEINAYKEYSGKKEVSRYDLDGIFIDKWDSIIDVFLELGIKTSGVIKCCQLKRKKAGNYQWRYYSGNENNIEPYSRKDQSGSNAPKTRIVYQFDVYGNFIKKWNSIVEAAKTYGLQGANIAKNCKGERRHCGEYIWSFKPETEIVLSQYERKLILDGLPLTAGELNPMAKKVYQYDMSGKYIREWGCVSEASSTLKINASNISECAGNRSRQSAGGYRWSYTYHECLDKYVKNVPNNKGKGVKPIIQLSKTGDFIREWNSITDASRELNINNASISRALTGHLKHAGGFKWKYKQ